KGRRDAKKPRNLRRRIGGGKIVHRRTAKSGFKTSNHSIGSYDLKQNRLLRRARHAGDSAWLVTGRTVRHNRPSGVKHFQAIHRSSVVATLTSRTILPASSTMQTLVSLTDTSSPAK